MKVNVIFEVLLFIFLILLQVLLLNQVTLFGFGTPLLYIYFLIKLPMGSNRFYVILSAFFMGLILDVFMNTLGMNAAALTMVSVLRKPLLDLLFSKEEFEDFTPGIYRSPGGFIRYVIAMVVIHQVLLFFIESFTFFNLTNTLLRIGVSSLITIILILAWDSLMYKKTVSE